VTKDDLVAWASQANENATKTALEILRTLILVHGGAIIAMLSFVGGLVGSGKLAGSEAAALSNPLMYFGWGIVITIITMILGYFTDGLVVIHSFELANVEARPTEFGNQVVARLTWTKRIIHTVGIGLTILSLLSFLGGIYALRSALDAALTRPSISAGASAMPAGKKSATHLK